MPRARGKRWAASAAVVMVLAVVLTTVGLVSGTPGTPSTDDTRTGSSTSVSGNDPVAANIVLQQKRLTAIPRDWTAWAALAADYVQQGRITADPTYYPKADGAVAKSLALNHADNFLALTVKASIAAARHDFAGALSLANQSLAVDAFNSSTYGVKGDALDELGRYSEAFRAFSEMDHLRPNVASFSRLSYAYELRGDITRARQELSLGLADASSPSDSAYVAYYLGELAWNSGDLTAAEKYYRQGVSFDADYVPPLEGVAKVEAARGRTSSAIRDYREVVGRLPLPQYVIEFADYLTSIGHAAEARSQNSLVLTEERLFQSQGVNVDLELSLYQADHGNPAGALTSAAAEYARRHSILVEDALAWALHMNGRDREALPHAAAALRLGTKSALFHFHRGVIEAALGMKPASIRDLQQALALNPQFSALQAPRARTILKALGAP